MTNLLFSLCLLSNAVFLSLAFAVPTKTSRGSCHHHDCIATQPFSLPFCPSKPVTSLHAGGEDDTGSLSAREPDELLLGVAGTGAALVMMYSEFVLSQTGCGLQAGPFGLVGGVEGISYLSVVGLGGYSLYKNASTGSGLPAGKFGLLGLAEGLAFLALFAGIVVLGLQITNFGYIPNAVPMEGGMCS